MNSQLQGLININSSYLKFFNHKEGKVEFQTLKQRQSEMKKAKDNDNFQEFNKLGGESLFNYIDGLIKQKETANYTAKKVQMDAGKENSFIKKHEKDRDNANPTGVGGIPKFNKGNVSRKIMNNKEVYNEDFIKEINKIKYLIEYMNNNKKIL